MWSCHEKISISLRIFSMDDQGATKYYRCMKPIIGLISCHFKAYFNAPNLPWSFFTVWHGTIGDVASIEWGRLWRLSWRPRSTSLYDDEVALLASENPSDLSSSLWWQEGTLLSRFFALSFVVWHETFRFRRKRYGFFSWHEFVHTDPESNHLIRFLLEIVFFLICSFCSLTL